MPKTRYFLEKKV